MNKRIRMKNRMNNKRNGVVLRPLRRFKGRGKGRDKGGRREVSIVMGGPKGLGSVILMIPGRDG